MIDLGTLSGGLGFSQATDVNDRGQVIGDSYEDTDGDVHGFLWEDDVMIDLGTLGGPLAGLLILTNAARLSVLVTYP